MKCKCGHKAKDHSETSGDGVTQGCQEIIDGSWCLCELSCDDVWLAGQPVFSPAPQDDAAAELRALIDNAPEFGGEPKTAFGREYREWIAQVKAALR